MNITFETIAQINATLSTIDVKGKKYTPVVERIKAFRMLYPQGSITTDIVSCENGVVIMKATVATEDGKILGTGTAFERMDSSFINKTSYIENCETSAVGRALGMAGIGTDASLCSADELLNAVRQQEEIKAAEQAKPNRAMIVKDFCSRFQITTQQFGSYRNLLIGNGGIPDKRINDLSQEEFDILLSFVEMNVSQPA